MFLTEYEKSETGHENVIAMDMFSPWKESERFSRGFRNLERSGLWAGKVLLSSKDYVLGSKKGAQLWFWAVHGGKSCAS